MKLKYKIINQKDLYSGFFKLKKIEFIHQKHDGTWTDQVDREIFGGAHVSTLLPYDSKRKEIVLIKQFRAGVISRYDEDYLFEIVAGIIDENESPEETAKRECYEETGCIVNKIIPMTIEDATTCCQRKGSEVLFAYAHIEKAGEDCIPIKANIYVIHIIPVQTPPIAFEPDETT